MNRLKALFISGFMTLLSITLFFSLWQLLQTNNFVWFGSLLAALVPLAFFIRLFVSPLARTGSLWWLPVAGILGAILALTSTMVMMLSLFVGTVMPLIYLFWYSTFEARDSSTLATGKTLTPFNLIDIDGHTWTSRDLSQQPALWLFYRGNWCPFCMAQIREIAASYRELSARGVKIYLISPQPEENTYTLAKQFDVPMTFLTDLNNEAARRLGILAENGLPTGLQVLGYDSDVPMPTVFITDANGRLIYSDLTSNYRLRPEPEDFMKALDDAGLTQT
ncbi:MAG: peroxiredoxin family protein [Moraxellaceae bacterium]|nr:peroxiredoxin family protein [Moraxellaceae bacterium]MDZ4385714.1 peroxiredoxin family protein [Moraxellaceae bacterium]